MVRQELVEILDMPLDISGKDIYIWGTGNTTLLYQEGLNRLDTEGSLHITGYVDNNSGKWGQTFCDKPVISPQELKEHTNACALICSPQPQVISAVRQQLKELQVSGYHIDEAILKLHKEKVLECYDLLYDAESQEIFAHIIACRINGEYPQEKYVSSEQYFALKNFRQRNPREVFIDCGAFVGDSAERYIWKKDGVFGKIIAFEPDLQNYRALEKRTDRLKEEWNFAPEQIEIYPYGISDHSSYSKVEQDSVNNGLSSKITESSSAEGVTCRIVTIDDFIKEPFTFLKADIESYEYRMISGAQNSITKYHPLLAVCIYHNAADLYDIPLFIKSLVPEYNIQIRHHSDLLDETVLYAWID
ncbi:MAG: FkbM family methyltransferase [Lachnospiraceae bacterium]|nr:FkbM family methyltransferase [Lachnospiraceae bacterium]